MQKVVLRDMFKCDVGAKAQKIVTSFRASAVRGRHVCRQQWTAAQAEEHSETNWQRCQQHLGECHNG